MVESLYFSWLFTCDKIAIFRCHVLMWNAQKTTWSFYFLSKLHVVCGDEYCYCYWIQSLFTSVCLYVVENTTIQPIYTMKQPRGPPCITWKTMWSLCFLLKLHIFGGYQYCYCYWIQSLLICVACMYVVVSTCTPSPPHTFIELVMTVPILSMARDQSTIWVMMMKMTATRHPQSKRALLYNSSQ